LLNNVEVFEQNCIKIGDIYFDPYLVSEETHDARIIFITHSHQDHFSLNDITKIKNEETVIVIPRDCLIDALSTFDKNHIIEVEPNNHYVLGDIIFDTVPMYNLNKSYHVLDKKWVGYVVDIHDIKYYIVGDSDDTEELTNVSCDVLFIPIGGTYTMNLEEAVLATEKVKPKIVVPTHYGTVVGSNQDGEIFKNKVSSTIECVVFKK